MNAENNKALVRRLIDEMWNKGQLDFARQCMAENAINHDPVNPIPPGPDGFMELVRTYRVTFPDVHFTVDDQIAESDKLVSRWTAVGTNHGELQGMPATHRPSTITGIQIDRFENDKIVKSWVNWDTVGMLQQLGVIPAPSQSRSR